MKKLELDKEYWFKVGRDYDSYCLVCDGGLFHLYIENGSRKLKKVDPLPWTRDTEDFYHTLRHVWGLVEENAHFGKNAQPDTGSEEYRAVWEAAMANNDSGTVVNKETLLESALRELKELKIKVGRETLPEYSPDQIDTVIVAIEKDLKLEEIDDNESEIWDIIATYGLENACRYLLDNDVGFSRWGYNKSPMMIAAEHGNREIVEMMLDHGWSPNEWTNIDEETPLLLAARAGAEDVFFLLLEKGADLNMVGYDYELTTDPKGERFDVTPKDLLNAAVIGKNRKICKFLVENIADMSSWPQPRYWPNELDHREILEFCLHSGIDVLAIRFKTAWDFWHRNDQ